MNFGDIFGNKRNGDGSSRLIKIPFKPVNFSSSLTSAQSSITCDNINCVKNIIFGNNKNGELIQFVCANCPKENAAHYCSVDCQKSSWNKHKRSCGKLTNPNIKWALNYCRGDDDFNDTDGKNDSDGKFSNDVASIRLCISRFQGSIFYDQVPLSFTDRLLFDNLEKDSCVKEHDAKLQKLEANGKIDTIIFILQHAWMHTRHDKKGSKGMATVFEVKLSQKEVKPEGAISLLNIKSLQSISSYLLKYMFDNEDRIESTSYIMLSDFSLKKGIHYPPGMANRMGLKLDEDGKIIDLGIYERGVMFMGPPCLRYETIEPFGIGEMTLDDISHKEIRIFSSGKLPNGVVICSVFFKA